MPSGAAGLGRLAAYEFRWVMGEVTPRLPGISKKPFGSVFLTQFEA
jgi:hypothetical protein